MAETVTLTDVYNELKQLESRMDRVATREDLEGLLHTVQLMNDPQAMAALRRSREDIEAGRTKDFTSLKDLLDEM